MLRRPKHGIWMIGALVIMALAGFLLADFALHNSVETATDELALTHDLPPSFAGHRWFFGTVLALLASVTLLAMGAVLENVRFLLTSPGRTNEPAKVGVINETLLLLAIAIGFGPDAVVLFAWGEAAAPLNSMIARIDRAFDGIATLVFIAWLVRRSKSRPVLLFQLYREPFEMSLEPTWEQLRPKLFAWLGIIVVSFGVAFGK